MSRLDPGLLHSRGFKPGSIVRLKMKNFLTYDECEFFTGPRLNIVIGPNGTGKSALTHAICLACCGSTGDVGRSTDLSKFVKHGAEGKESYAEVDIFTEERTLITIRREINSENKGSKWFLNGKSAKQADVKTIVKDLSIDVDNLCSFMPQDKVGNFSRASPKEMLGQTLLAIREPGAEFCLLEEQHALSHIQDAKEEYRRKCEAKTTALNNAKKELESMRSEIERMQRREERVALLQQYEIRLLAVEIGELEVKSEEKQKVVDEKTEALQLEIKKIFPLETEERSLNLKQATRTKAAEETQSMQRKIDDSLRHKKDNLSNFEVELDTASNDLLLLARTRATKVREREILAKKLEDSIAEEQQSRSLLPSLVEKVAAVKAELGALNSEKADAEEATLPLHAEAKRQRDAMTAINTEKDSLKDFKQIFRTKMSRSNDPAVRRSMQAMDWLDANIDQLRGTGQLRSQVYGPVAMYCDVADPACAAMIEKAIPTKKLYGFVVDNDADRDLLKREIRVKQNIAIDIYTMKKVNLSPRKPYSEALIRSLGLTGYLCEQIECPDIIRALFYTFHNFESVLWGRGADNLTYAQQADLCRVSNGFKLYIHEVGNRGQQQQQMSITEYTGKKSRNPQAPPSTSSIAIGSKGILSSKGGGDDVTEAKARLDTQFKEAQQRLRQVEARLNELGTTIRAITNATGPKKDELTSYANALKKPDSLKATVQSLTTQLGNLDRDLARSANLQPAARLANYKAKIRAMLDAAADAVKLCDKSTQHRVDRCVAVSLQNDLKEAIDNVKLLLQEAKRGEVEIKKELKLAEKARDDAQRRAEDKERELNQKIASTGLTPQAFAEDVYVKIVACCPEDTTEQIHARMEALHDEINRVADNPLLQSRCDEVTAAVARLEAELKQSTAEHENAEESLNNRSLRWLSQVEKTTEKLHLKFQEYMGDLQLGGSVELKKIGKFDDYELQLNVRFREGQDLAPLDGNKHSGGERAVSTVMFLMALQNMTTSPFRVVDEINQGMDESNERLVFDRIVKSCCGDRSKPQYFLVTPKLLQGLGAMNNEDVTILLVWNGPGTNTKWTFGQVLQKLSGDRYSDEVLTQDSIASLMGSQQRRGRGNAASTAAKAKKGKRAIVESESEEEEEQEEVHSVPIKKQRM